MNNKNIESLFTKIRNKYFKKLHAQNIFIKREKNFCKHKIECGRHADILIFTATYANKSQKYFSSIQALRHVQIYIFFKHISCDQHINISNFIAYHATNTNI